MSLISWTDITANPIHLIREDGSHGGHWCHKVSPAVQNAIAKLKTKATISSSLHIFLTQALHQII